MNLVSGIKGKIPLEGEKKQIISFSLLSIADKFPSCLQNNITEVGVVWAVGGGVTSNPLSCVWHFAKLRLIWIVLDR